MAAWPESLPCFLADGYQEAPVSQTIESQMASGPPKSRRRSTAQYRNISVSISVTEEQADIFEDFFRDEAPDSVPFSITQPRTGKPVQCRIVGDPPYVITPIGTGSSHFKIAFQLQTSP